LIDRSVDNPYTVLVATLFMVLAGWAAGVSLPLQLRPTVEPPEIDVQASYPGAAPVEVEDQVTRRIEQQLRGVAGLREVVSTSNMGRASITLKFEDGVDRDAAMVDVLNKMQGVRGLPPEVDAPEVNALTSDQQMVMMWLGVRAPAGLPATPVPILRAAVDDTIAPAMRRVEGVADLIVSGGEEREIHVVTDFGALTRRGLSVPGLLAALGRESVNQRGGPMQLGKREYNVRVAGRPESLEAIGDLVLRRDEAGVVRLADVARVERAGSIDTSIMRQDGIPAVAVGIRRRTGANVPATTEAVLAQVAELTAMFHDSGLPVGLRVLYSEADYIGDALWEAVENVAVGTLLAALTLLVVLRSWRAVALVGLAQPLSVLGVFPVLWLAGRSMNIITLAGLAFAVGITIDNAIVVIENVFRLREHGLAAGDAARRGTAEVAGAMLAATITNVCVFAPVVFLGGEAGQIFRDLAIGVSVAALLSLLVVLTVLPTAAARWLGPVPVRAGGGPGPFARTYGAVIDRLTARPPWARWAVLLAAVMASLLGFMLVPDASYLPEGNRNLIVSAARPLPGTGIHAAAELLTPIEQGLVRDPRVHRTFVVFNSRMQAIGTVLEPEFAAAGPFGAFLGELRGRVSAVPGFRFIFPRRASIFTDPGRQFDVILTGPDLAVLERLAGKAQALLKPLPGVASVRSNYETGTPEVRVTPDRARLAMAGLRAADLADAVEAAVGGVRVGTYLDEGRELDLVVVGEASSRADPAALAATPIAPGLTIDDLATVDEALGPVSIPHRNQLRAITLQVSVAEDVPLGRALARAEDAVIRPLRQELSPGYALLTGGTADRLADTLAGLAKSFGWAVLIVYLLLVALYRGWGQPVVILTAVPLAVCGALLALAAVNAVSHVDFDTITMLGLILLCGVVVNTSILIVSQAKQFAAGGMAPPDALRASAVTRLRPILVSAFTSVVGMLPLAAGQGSGTELYRGLGVVMVGGLLLSTVFVPLVVPAMMATSAYWRR
jgi:HAE1 family hydrophobic/amphiphilic exporter-1